MHTSFLVFATLFSSTLSSASDAPIEFAGTWQGTGSYQKGDDVYACDWVKMIFKATEGALEGDKLHALHSFPAGSGKVDVYEMSLSREGRFLNFREELRQDGVGSLDQLHVDSKSRAKQWAREVPS